MAKNKMIYFAHPIKTYKTRKESEILAGIRTSFPGHSIIDPADMKVAGFVDCKDCMKNHMIPTFFKRIKECDILIIWGERNSCGIRCELNKAWELGKEVYEVQYSPCFSKISLQDYHYKVKGY